MGQKLHHVSPNTIEKSLFVSLVNWNREIDTVICFRWLDPILFPVLAGGMGYFLASPGVGIDLGQ